MNIRLEDEVGNPCARNHRVDKALVEQVKSLYLPEPCIASQEPYREPVLELKTLGTGEVVRLNLCPYCFGINPNDLKNTLGCLPSDISDGFPFHEGHLGGCPVLMASVGKIVMEDDRPKPELCALPW